jgi:hypothetical protein
MGEAKRRKLVGTTTNDRDHEAQCPWCNTRDIVRHVLDHSDDIRMVDGEPVLYLLGGDETRLTVDFGVLAIVGSQSGMKFRVVSFGEDVMTMTPDDLNIRRHGSWIATLAAIREQLDERFGPVRYDPDVPRHQH